MRAIKNIKLNLRLGSLEVDRVYNYDAITGLGMLPDNYIQCVISSPPYWNLRDYQVEGQLGQEKTPEEFVEHLVVIFREVRRVLRDDGVVFLNIGDSYTGSGVHAEHHANPGMSKVAKRNADIATPVPVGLKAKDLCMIPARLALVLQADGWWIRSDIIWLKPNPMPESCTDRPTKSYEHLFMLTKRANYWYDVDAVREPHLTKENRPDGIIRNRIYGYDSKENKLRGYKQKENYESNPMHHGKDVNYHQAGRNLRNVWEIENDEWADFLEYREWKRLYTDQTNIWGLTTEPLMDCSFCCISSEACSTVY